MKSKKFLFDYAERVYNMEVDRQNSLITQAGRMVTIQGLFLVIFGLFFNNFTSHDYEPIINTNIIVLIVLISLFLSVLVQIRLPKRYLPKIEDVEKVMSNAAEPKEILDETIYDFYTLNIEKMNRVILKTNLFRSITMTLSTVAFLACVVLTTIDVIALF